VVVSSVFKWALSREGRTKLPPPFQGKDNPAHEVFLPEEKRIIHREKSYWLGERKAILQVALKVNTIRRTLDPPMPVDDCLGTAPSLVNTLIGVSVEWSFGRVGKTGFGHKSTDTPAHGMKLQGNVEDERIDLPYRLLQDVQGWIKNRAIQSSEFLGGDLPSVSTSPDASKGNRVNSFTAHGDCGGTKDGVGPHDEVTNRFSV